MISAEFVESRLPVGSSASRIAGSLIKRPRDRDALLLTARELIRMVLLAPLQANQFEQFPGAILAFAVPCRIEQRQLDVLQRTGARKQVEVLKDEADLAAAHQCQLFLGQRRDIDVLKVVASAGRAIEAAKDVHQGRFAGSRRSHDRDELAALDREADAVERAHLDLAQLVDLEQIGNFDNRCHDLMQRARRDQKRDILSGELPHRARSPPCVLGRSLPCRPPSDRRSGLRRNYRRRVRS